MRVLIVQILILVCSVCRAQDSYIRLEISPLNAEKGEPVKITIKTDADINANALQLELPDEFIRSGGVIQGTKSSTNFQTGQVERYTYQSFAGHFEKVGNYKIGPIKIQTKKGVLKSLAYDIKITKPINLISADPSKNLKEPIFGVIEQSKLEIYEGESVLLGSKVYSQFKIFQLDAYGSFELSGQSENHLLQNNQKLTRTIEKIGNKDLETFTCGKTLVFPEQAGKYDINPFEMILLYEDDNLYAPQRARIKSNQSELLVKPLPPNAPKNFIGGVGNFKLNTFVNDSRVKEGDVFEYTIRVSGNGNLHNINEPKLVLPKGLVVYGDAVIKDSIIFSSRGAEGALEYTFNVQATQEGRYEIEAVAISFFNPTSKKYETIKGKTQKIRVKGDNITVKSNTNTLQPKQDGKKLKTILVNANPVENGNSFYGTVLFWGVLSTPIALAFLFGFIVKHREENEEKIAESQKKKGAKKVAKHKLETALVALKNRETNTFYLEIEKSIKLFIGNKLGMPETAVTRTVITDLKDKEKIDADLKNGLFNIFNKCDEARFGLEASTADMEKLFAETNSIINALEKVLK